MSQHKVSQGGFPGPACRVESIIPNPKLKLLDQIHEVMRLKHYSLRTERAYCDGVRRYVQFHHLRSRDELLPAEPKIEAFLSHLAVEQTMKRATELVARFL
jgi:hypothetical protein